MLTIRDDIRPGNIEEIILHHRILYEKEFGLNSEFGDYVEESLNEPYEKLWIAEIDGVFSGCIGLVEADASTGQLRWFLVEPSARGKELGKKLMTEFLHYCHRKKYEKIYLWTVNILPAARKIYEDFGFQLTQSKPETVLWGQILSEQRFDLIL